jgi:hypothetical protein
MPEAKVKREDVLGDPSEANLLVSERDTHSLIVLDDFSSADVLYDTAWSAVFDA